MLVLAVWAAPLLIAPPLFSRDVYSYLAQGAMVDAHIDVYAYGPAHLGGPLADEVAPLWRHTGAPYGPVFLGVASALSDLTRGELPAGLLGMRLIALLGVALMAAALPRLARHSGADPAAALWLGALNPLVLLHLVAGAHNDAIMLGLLGAGLVAALGRWPVLGAVLVTLAALVKAPAALGLAAVVLLQMRSGHHPAKAVLTTVAAVRRHHGRRNGRRGHGIRLDRRPGHPGLPAELGAHQPARPVPPPRCWPRSAAILRRWPSRCGTCSASCSRRVSCCLIWWRWRPRPVYALGLSLAAVAAFGPAIRPWYALWGLFLIAAAAPSTSVRHRVAALTGVLALAVLPSGGAADAGQLVPGGLRRRARRGRPVAGASRGAGPGVGAHRMRLPRTDRGRLALVLVLAAAVTVFTATVPLLRDWFDLRVYYGTVDSWMHHGGRIYDYRVPGTTYGFTYPPFAAVVMLPMALVDLHVAIAVALLLNLAALAVRAARAGGTGLAAPRLVRLCAGRVRAGPLRTAAGHLQLRSGQHPAAGSGAPRRWLLARPAGPLGRRGHRARGGDQTDAGRRSSACCWWPGAGEPLPWRRPSPPRRRRWRRGWPPTRPASTGRTRCGTPPGWAASTTSPTSRCRASWPVSACRTEPSWAVVVLLVLGVWGARDTPGGRGGGLDGGVRPDRADRLSGQPDHLGPPPGVAAAVLRRPRPRRAPADRRLPCTPCCAPAWCGCGSTTRPASTASSAATSTPGSRSACCCGCRSVSSRRLRLDPAARHQRHGTGPQPGRARDREGLRPADHASAFARGAHPRAPRAGPGLGLARKASSDPTGSTRPAAPNPQSSSSRASS